MEKISGILPSSARVSSVDLKESGPVRPGTPSFGRPEGVSSLRDAAIGQTSARASKIIDQRMDWKTKDQQQAAMARTMSENFFKTRLSAPAITETVQNSITLQPIETIATNTFQPAQEEAESSTELYPRGSFIDVQA